MSALSFSHLTALEVGPPDLIDLVADAGFASTGIRLHPAMPGGVAYPLGTGSAALRQTQERLRARGVRVLDIEVLRVDGQTDVASFLPYIEAGAALGASRLCVNGEDPELDRFTETFAQLCALVKPYGMEVDLEFMVWRPVRTLEIAARIVRNAGCPNGKVLIDALHLQRSGGQVEDVVRMDPALIGALQLCDGPLAGPDPSDTAAILAEARAGRLPPLEGEFPLLELIRALPADTPISVEVPMGPRTGYPDLASRLAHIRGTAERCLSIARPR